MKKTNIVLKIINITLAVLIVLSVGFRIYYSDISSTAGNELSYYTGQFDMLEKENQILQNEYYTLTSLSSLSAKAQELGYVSAVVDYYTSPSLASR